MGTILVAAMGALMIALGFFLVTTWELLRVERNQRIQVVEMTNSYATAFGETRGDGAEQVATFRRLGLEHFSTTRTQSTDGVTKALRISGIPGAEIETREPNPRLRGLMAGFSDRNMTGPISELRLENGRVIGRDILPFFASAESCVSCHNGLLGRDAFQVGDTMGAFVVESDLTAAIWRNAYLSCFAFLAALVAFVLLARRERHRVREVIKSLKARVYLEQAKAEAEAQASFLLSHDALTGLANRTMFHERLQAELESQTRSDVVVGAIDLDDFKAVNDTLGHATGDALLTEISNRLTRVIEQAGGLVARLGGDEFAFIVRLDARFASPDVVGAAIQAALADGFSYEQNNLQPNCSIGIAKAGDLGAVTPNEVLKAADASLYAAKAAGKNTVRYFDDDIRASLWRRTLIAGRLPDAVRKNGIRAALQPKVCIRTGTFQGFEALARWRLDDEEIPPLEFTRIAEEIGMIRDVDMAVLRSAAAFSIEQEAKLSREVPFSTNISALNFRSSGLAEAVLDILWHTKLPPERLTLEVTESTAVENWQSVQKAASILRETGVRISLDDFGTGYSSLSYLRRFGFEEIKIDRDFITDIEEDDETRFLFESIVDMATGLGKNIVVEGIETREQARIVSEKASVMGQGYLYSKPLELDQAAAYLRQSTGAVA